MQHKFLSHVFISTIANKHLDLLTHKYVCEGKNLSAFKHHLPALFKQFRGRKKDESEGQNAAGNAAKSLQDDQHGRDVAE